MEQMKTILSAELAWELDEIMPDLAVNGFCIIFSLTGKQFNKNMSIATME